MKRAIIELAFEGKTYTIIDDWDYDWMEDKSGEEMVAAMHFQWEENNYACDDNRSLFIQWQCDPDFPEMTCGNKIELLSMEVVDG